MLIFGIDPGKTGAWGAITHNGDYHSCGDMYCDANGYLETEKIWDEICMARDGQDCVVVLERVASRPMQGVVSVFSFGTAFGGALSLAKRFKTEVVMVTPQLWKKTLKLSSSKDLSLDMARDLFRQAPLRLKKYNGRAEALLIAEWYRRKNNE
jgi:crossover junction endodeoxyribonuclease RuvC